MASSVKSLLVRAAGAGDAAAIAAIYNQGIEERGATFESEARSSSDLGAWFSGAAPFLVAQLDGAVVGFARLAPYSDRPCYAGVGEAAIYVKRSARGRGIARALLDRLARRAERAGYWKIVGLLFASNRASLALARAMGYREVGTFVRHGRLDGRWRDVVCVELLLGEAATA